MLALAAWDNSAVCLRGSKIKTQAYSLIRPLSRVWRQNGAGTMTPRRWRLTPSPTLLTAPQNRPSPTRTPLLSLTPLSKEPVRTGPPFSPHTHRHRNKPSTLRCCHRPWGYPAKNSGPPKNSTLSPSLCLIPLSPRSLSLQDR